MNLDKVTVLTHCSNDIAYIDTFVDRWKAADDIYILVDNCTDGTYQKLLEYSKTYPQFHIFYHAYTIFRFDLIRNDLFSYVRDREGIFLFVSTDCWFIEDEWRELFLKFCKHPEYIADTEQKRLNLSKESWLLGIDKANSLAEYLTFHRHPFFQEKIWIYRGNLNRWFTVNPGGGEGFRLLDGAVDTIELSENDNEIFPLHLFHARHSGEKDHARWPSKYLIACNIKHLIFLALRKELGDDAFSSWKYLAGKFLENSSSFQNPQKIYKLLSIVLTGIGKDDFMKEEADRDIYKDASLIKAFLESKETITKSI